MPPRPKQEGSAAAGASSMPDSTGSFTTKFGTAFAIFLMVNIMSALKAPIADCDETYNYWEPTHYLSHGYGLQTWEYSPEYAIRSWTYIAIHAVIGRIGYLFTSSKVFEFYWIRCVLAAVCAYCETKLFATIARVLNPRVSIMFMIVMLSSAGMFSASSAYLPSSFAMYANMLGASAFMDWRDGSHTAAGIMWFGVGGIIGWPFSAALVLPFFIEDLAITWVHKQWQSLFQRSFDGCVRLVVLLVLTEAFFYHKAIVVPWNIVAYNVFSGAGKGPDIFGMEPADFYVRNLLLNFNAWTLLALAAGPLLLLQYVFRRHGSALGVFRSFVFVSPFYMWLAIFSLQRHKEERFMYPAYPFLALNAAIGLHAILGWFGNPDPRTLLGKIPPAVKLAVVACGVLGAMTIGIFRAVGSVSAYSAPLKVYDGLASVPNLGTHTNLCLGKEWYRFPTSYFLPNGVHARFVKSEFRGLLPGQFSEAKSGFGVFPGTWLVPGGMNDRNIEDPSKYVQYPPCSHSREPNLTKSQVDLSRCDFLVDSMLEGQPPTSLEPAHINNTAIWEPIRCEPFLDAGRTHVLARLIWIPEVDVIPQRFRRQWGQYCLLQRRSRSRG